MTGEGDLQRAVEQLTATINQLRMELVRKDVYDADEARRTVALQHVVDDVAEIKKDRETERRDKEQEQRDLAKERRADRRLLYGVALTQVAALVSYYFSAKGGA